MKTEIFEILWKFWIVFEILKFFGNLEIFNFKKILFLKF